MMSEQLPEFSRGMTHTYQLPLEKKKVTLWRSKTGLGSALCFSEAKQGCTGQEKHIPHLTPDRHVLGLGYVSKKCGEGWPNTA